MDAWRLTAFPCFAGLAEPTASPCDPAYRRSPSPFEQHHQILSGIPPRHADPCGSSPRCSGTDTRHEPWRQSSGTRVPCHCEPSALRRCPDHSQLKVELMMSTFEVRYLKSSFREA